MSYPFNKIFRKTKLDTIFLFYKKTGIHYHRIEPIVPNWTPHLRGPALELSTLLFKYTQQHTANLTPLGPPPPKAGPALSHDNPQKTDLWEIFYSCQIIGYFNRV